MWVGMCRVELHLHETLLHSTGGYDVGMEGQVHSVQRVWDYNVMCVRVVRTYVEVHMYSVLMRTVDPVCI